MTDAHYAVFGHQGLGMSAIVDLTRVDAMALFRVWKERMPGAREIYVLDMNTMEKIAKL